MYLKKERKNLKESVYRIGFKERKKESANSLPGLIYKKKDGWIEIYDIYKYKMEEKNEYP